MPFRDMFLAISRDKFGRYSRPRVTIGHRLAGVRKPDHIRLCLRVRARLVLDQRRHVLQRRGDLGRPHPFRHLLQLRQEGSLGVGSWTDLLHLLRGVQARQLGPPLHQFPNAVLGFQDHFEQGCVDRGHFRHGVRRGRPDDAQHVVEAFDFELADLLGRLGDERLERVVDDFEGSRRGNPEVHPDHLVGSSTLAELHRPRNSLGADYLCWRRLLALALLFLRRHALGPLWIRSGFALRAIGPGRSIRPGVADARCGGSATSPATEQRTPNSGDACSASTLGVSHGRGLSGYEVATDRGSVKKVVDCETGEVIYEAEGKLGTHTGHGSDKLNSSAAEPDRPEQGVAPLGRSATLPPGLASREYKALRAYARHASGQFSRACPHLSQASAQTICNPARKLRAVFS